MHTNVDLWDSSKHLVLASAPAHISFIYHGQGKGGGGVFLGSKDLGEGVWTVQQIIPPLSFQRGDQLQSGNCTL